MQRFNKTNSVFALACLLVFSCTTLPNSSAFGHPAQDKADTIIENTEKASNKPDQTGNESNEKKTLDADEQKKHLQTLASASKEADSAKEYSAVIERCENELGEYSFLSANEKYIRTIIAWSLNRRGELRMELGFEFDRVGNSSEAEAAFGKASADFERAIQEDATQWKAFLNRGIVRSQAEDWNNAIRDFQTSVKLRPTQTFAYFNLAEIEYQRKHFKASLAYYDQILKNSKNDTQALNGRALALAGLQRFDEALDIYDQLLEAHPEDAQLFTNRGDLLQSTGKWSEAEQSYVEALKHQQAAAIYRRLAWLFATCPDETIRQPDGALVMAKKSISLSRDTSAAQWDTLAAAMALNGDYQAAMDCMKQAIEQEPDNDNFAQRLELYGQSQTYQQVPSVAKKDSQLLDR